MKYQAAVNGNTIQIEKGKAHWLLNGTPVVPDLLLLDAATIHLIWDGRSITFECISIDKETKEIVLKSGDVTRLVKLSDTYDLLLHELGFDAAASKAVSEVKAPMPGLVLKVLIEVGQQVEKGEVLMVLEAMKMENSLKSPTTGKISKVLVKPGDKVDKNALLLGFAS